MQCHYNVVSWCWLFFWPVMSPMYSRSLKTTLKALPHLTGHVWFSEGIKRSKVTDHAAESLHYYRIYVNLTLNLLLLWHEPTSIFRCLSAIYRAFLRNSFHCCMSHSDKIFISTIVATNISPCCWRFHSWMTSRRRHALVMHARGTTLMTKSCFHTTPST